MNYMIAKNTGSTPHDPCQCGHWNHHHLHVSLLKPLKYSKTWVLPTLQSPNCSPPIPLWHLISHNPSPLPGQQSVQTDKSAPEVSTTWSPGGDVGGHGDDDDSDDGDDDDDKDVDGWVGWSRQWWWMRAFFPATSPATAPLITATDKKWDQDDDNPFLSLLLLLLELMKCEQQTCHCSSYHCSW